MLCRWTEHECRGQSGRAGRQRQLARFLTLRVQRVHRVEPHRARTHCHGPGKGCGFRIFRRSFLLYDIS